MRAFGIFAGFLLWFFFATHSAYGQSNTNVIFGPYAGTCSNNTLRTNAFIDQDDIDFWSVLTARTRDFHRYNGNAITIPNEDYLYDPAMQGNFHSYLSFCPGGASPNWVGTWRRESHLALLYAICYPGFDDPPDPRSNPMCWWGVECFGGHEPCVDIDQGYID